MGESRERKGREILVRECVRESGGVSSERKCRESDKKNL